MAGNRSENTYQKINTIFKRDNKNIIMPYEHFTQPEIEYMKNCLWHCEEKIDGTNIRIEIIPRVDWVDRVGVKGIEFNVEYKGKSDKAQVPNDLIEYLKINFPEDKVLAAFDIKKYISLEEFADYGFTHVRSNIFEPQWVIEGVPNVIDIYGEGYGAGIQSGGYYRKDKAFILFDVAINKNYLCIKSRNEIAEKLGADIVPFVGDMTIPEAIEFVKKGFDSLIAQEKHLAEGLVLRPACERNIMNIFGSRLICKIKTCDFTKYFNTYHTFEKVEQIPNKHIEE